jgi:hypothetical protein
MTPNVPDDVSIPDEVVNTNTVKNQLTKHDQFDCDLLSVGRSVPVSGVERIYCSNCKIVLAEETFDTGNGA